MHVVMFIDEERFRREGRMLNGLATGLIERGLKVTRILPAPVLAALEDTPGNGVISGVSDHGYPPRVMQAARAMETLHRELWQAREGGRSALALGGLVGLGLV